MKSIKFKDNIIRQYPINILKEIPFFKSLIESCNDITLSVNFNCDIIDYLIYNYNNINFGRYDFDELFKAKEFLRLYEKSMFSLTSGIQDQFTDQLRYLLLNDKINLNNLPKYTPHENAYFMSSIINEKPKLIQLYPYVTNLIYINEEIDLSKFNNLTKLTLSTYKTIKTFNTFNNLKNLKILNCARCDNLEDGCFDIFVNLEKLNCGYCSKLKNPFNINLKNLRKLYCQDCYNLEDRCFDVFTNLKTLYCSGCKKISNPFNNNLKNLKKLDCARCSNLKDGCFDMLLNLKQLSCNFCFNLKTLFNNLINLKKLYCFACHKLEHGCLDKLTNLEELDCADCNFIKISESNLKKLRRLVYRGRDHSLTWINEPFDIVIQFENLGCTNYIKFKKNLIVLPTNYEFDMLYAPDSKVLRLVQ